ncbi:hypothetical protein VB264_16895 [Arcicella aquatica]|uniref:Uncharacterized protein n=1 Tax=Arcicella aquatica TaxID=217141 RepID=A0ABU5QRU8_9BACT|nr:hypothetical protein [Arcicella aquatica]MEA5259480.1 hypothetical protein [Arcicella aquatica]
MILPKRPGEAEREAQKAYCQQLVRDYFEGLKIIDTESEVIHSRLLSKQETLTYQIKVTPTKTIIILQ